MGLGHSRQGPVVTLRNNILTSPAVCSVEMTSVDTFSVQLETQGRIGLIQTEGALLMHSKLTVTTRTTAVPLASMQRHG